MLQFNGQDWVSDPLLLEAMKQANLTPPPRFTTDQFYERSNSLRFRDLDSDGFCEVLINHGNRNEIFSWNQSKKVLDKLPFALPEGTRFSYMHRELRTNGDGGIDAGLRFADINEDGFDDIIFSNESEYGLWLFTDMKQGWSREVLRGKRGQKPADQEIPPITVNGANNGAWFQSHHLLFRRHQRHRRQ